MPTFLFYDCSKVDISPLQTGAPEDKEQYPRGALQRTVGRSADINPEIKESEKNTEKVACGVEQKMVKEITEGEKPEQNGSTKPRQTWTTEEPSRPLQAESAAISGQTNTRASRIPGGMLLTQKYSPHTELAARDVEFGETVNKLGRFPVERRVSSVHPNTQLLTKKTFSFRGKDYNGKRTLKRVWVKTFTPYPFK
ncbi:hypothetical protein NDU88_007775 [Pleurodeles waltl]|uniref:Uncharacterized protein n=1 Tax=Pleurodeles waltl TaxID=8319 RepID=A0AAV7NX98_PLEWA|nr:hypothetical protein NDU88_007775 [Pleurodeles waltl]